LSADSINPENVGDSRQKSTPRLDRTRRQHGFKIGAAQVSRAEPDNFGRRPFEREPLKKVGIFGQKRPAVAASVIPDQLVGGLLTQGGGMQAGILSGLKPKTGCLKSHPLRIRGKKRLGRFRVLRVFRGHSSDRFHHGSHGYDPDKTQGRLFQIPSTTNPW